MFNTALPSLIDYKVFYSREGNKIILNISGGWYLEPVPPDPAVLDISAALNLLLCPPAGTLPPQLQGASHTTDCGSKLGLGLQHLPLIQEQS